MRWTNFKDFSHCKIELSSPSYFIVFFSLIAILNEDSIIKNNNGILRFLESVNLDEFQ